METDPDYLEVVDLWLSCRAGDGGLRHLPERGGVMEQGAWIMDALQICAGTAAWLDKEMPVRRRK